MTTRVTVDAHAGWPVHVKTIDKEYPSGEWKETGTETVPANETRDFYVHDARRLMIEEGKRD